MSGKAKLKTAIIEAERFLLRAKIAEKKCEYRKFESGLSGGYDVADGVTFAAAKRASMDLTRALADLRRPG